MDHNYLFYSPINYGDVILVLGATCGDFMKEHAAEIKRKNAFVINVEPTFRGTAELAAFIEQYLPSQATVVSCALSDAPGLLTLEIRDNLITSALESRPETNMRWPMGLLYKMKTVTLTFDTLLAAIGRVDKVFCDIEGSELEVFGASKLLDTIPYYAIAAYHMRDGVATAETMKPMFPNHRIIVDGEASPYNKHEVVLFALKP